MNFLHNPFRGVGLKPQDEMARGEVSTDPSGPEALLRRCPEMTAPTPLRDWPNLARAMNVKTLTLKDESQRMGLGSFKALGAAYVIAREAALRTDTPDVAASPADMKNALRGTVYVCASAGNHGLSMAAGARIFGAVAVVYLSQAIPEAFANRLRRLDAKVVRAGEDYEASMAAAAAAARDNGWILLSDSSWPSYTDLPARVMEGYLIMGVEVVNTLETPPSHIFLQAGVGGMAAAMAAFFRKRWGDSPTIVVVEPQSAAALFDSIRAGKPVRSDGPASIMGRLDCKEPSHLALAELARTADYFLTITDEESNVTVELLQQYGIETTPSGGAGVSALHHAGSHRSELGLSGQSRVLSFITEGPEEIS
ncbi:MAG: diaminopropionate ammonia-lyase [Candidimonas sp.]|nr:MAG: diaminopropionate ammonia-lyase [Candidimonas sp.]TAM25393.1 MAG: diaminopropionate ammonia-lyase [Candidimonas sp.]